MKLHPALTLSTLLAAGALAPSFAQAQATTSELGTYTICRTASAGQACHEVSLSTAPRLDASGLRTGTVGTVSLRNLQGSSFTGPDGTSYGTGTAASMLTGVTFYTQGCLPGQACASPFYFDGLPFGRTEGGTASLGSSGPVGGSVPPWGWAAEKPLAGDNPNTLRFVASSLFNGTNNQQGIGGCASGSGQLAGQFSNIFTAVSTCAAQSFSGAVQFSFATAFVFDPTYFIGLRVDWAQQTTPGIGAYAPYFCGVGVNQTGQGTNQGGGTCVSIPSISAVPEPATWASLTLGLAALVLGARRRQQQT